jgi:lysozyme
MQKGKLFAAAAAAAMLGMAQGCTSGPKPPAAVTAPAPAVQGGGRVAPPFASLHTTDAVVQMIKDGEGLRLAAYKGAQGEWLIGYGHAGDDVSSGKKISAAQADALLRADLVKTEDAVKGVVKTPINADELSAMVDLAYNIGTGSFGSSSVVRQLNAGDRAAAADAFLLWDKATINGQRAVDPALHSRRERERAIFLGKPLPAAPTAASQAGS